jgi:hypothetical protein
MEDGVTLSGKEVERLRVLVAVGAGALHRVTAARQLDVDDAHDEFPPRSRRVVPLGVNCAMDRPTGSSASRAESPSSAIERGGGVVGEVLSLDAPAECVPHGWCRISRDPRRVSTHAW